MLCMIKSELTIKSVIFHPQGLQLAVGKQKPSPWEILEGHKNPAPLSLAWFGAVKMERKPLMYEEQHRYE